MIDKIVEEMETYKNDMLNEEALNGFEHCRQQHINDEKDECFGRDCFLCVADALIEIVKKYKNKDV